MEKIYRFFECLVPVTACNLRCDYCYIIQQDRRENSIPKFKHSPEYIGKAFNKKRVGGTALVSITGAGETLIPKEMPKIIEEILKQGHFVNITTNGTLTNRFDEILMLDSKLLEHLHFSFSLHYNELKRLNMIDTFFDNVQKVKKAGCSILVQFNLYDGYEPHIEEIKKICLEKVGELPQVAVTRREVKKSGNKKTEFEIYTSKTTDEYKKIGEEFKSPLFEFTMKNFNIKRNEFCYAGKWSYLLNLATGDLSRCYFEAPFTNFYKNIEEKIKSTPIGNGCKYRYCVNSSHFMSLGVIPEIDSPTYGSLRDRANANWHSMEMKEFLDSKLSESNKQYNKIEKIFINIENKSIRLFKKIKNKIRRVLKNEQ